VLLTMDGRRLAVVAADAAGTYAVAFRVPPEATLGDHDVVATCGAVTSPPETLSVVQEAGQTATPVANLVTSSAVLVFFLLLGGQVLRVSGVSRRR
jgi:hypothetical protein